MMKFLAVVLFSFAISISYAQQKRASVKGYILDDNNNPLGKVSVFILGQNKGTFSNDSGYFLINTPAEKAFALVFSYNSYLEIQKNFFLSAGITENITIIMKKAGITMNPVIIKEDRERKENGLIKLDPKNAVLMPSTTGGIEGLIKTMVGSNNELTSQYSVRGGNYDENLVYINDFEIYRPYLVSNGQQEGLSFINPELVKNINFYTGGFQSKYGDKMSSVLDIQYKQPQSFEGSAYISMLEQGISVAGNLKKNKATFLLGARNKNNRGLLSRQPTVGAYIPSSSDLQTLITLQLNEKWKVDFLGILSGSRFTYFPEFVKKTASVFSPFFTANVGVDTYFEGSEKDNYSTSLLGATIIHSPRKNLTLKWMASTFHDVENENYDIAGAYLFGDRDFDKSSSSYGEIINPLGAGYYQQYARNKLTIEVLNLSHKGSLDYKKNSIQWGNNIEHVHISDKINQFEYQDSAGYSLPYSNTSLQMYSAFNSNANLNIYKYSGFLQCNSRVSRFKNNFSIQTGVRYNYNTLNKELLVSPRIQASWKPQWKNDVVIRIATGIYDQPPFYRELKKYNGELNTNIQSQKSIQFIGGIDYQFLGINEKPFRLSTEAYYKKMSDVIPYDIDNVKIKYLGANNAVAYATGIELRLFTELVKDAESWFSIGFMKTKENLMGDHFYQYKNASGEIITSSSSDQIATDTISNDIGYLRRPTDRLITAGLFLQDYLATNKNFKVHFNLLYGSNMPYNIPNSVKYRNALTINAYIRADIGFSALLLSEKNIRRSHSPFRNIQNVWASLEIFNLIDKANTISYQLIKDFANNIYAIPNRLTPRMLNFKIVSRF